MRKSTIVVSPRERYTSIIPSLLSIFNTVDKRVSIIVVEGASPDACKKEIAALKLQREFKHISVPYPITPNEARNIGAKEVATEFIIFADNDIEYTSGWLEALEKNADTNNADAVAPLIFIGPTENPVIHHAGGKLIYEYDGENRILAEKHRFMNTPLDEVESQIADISMLENDVCEFHCMLMRKTLYDKMGALDERLITREQIDFALRCKDIGARVTFEKDSRVTYLAYNPFNPVDLEYHLFRWSDERAIQSINAFQNTWKVKIDADRIRFRRIKRRRDRAIASAYPMTHKLLRRFIRPLLSNKLERKVKGKFDKERKGIAQPSTPHKPQTPWAGTLFGLDTTLQGEEI
ncbi:MAG: glycosyltransferase [Planctomycetes bacterium]|nr:glycosyltransferase [Planctomycetota bacterium]